LLHLGIIRPRSAAALVHWLRDVARRRLPPDVPLQGQGAAQAIEDGATLAACLLAAGNADPAPSLRHY
jgi:hypothetical protein